jgi:preprotein translocase subunit SecF
MNRLIDDLKAVTASVVGVGVQYSAIDMEIKIVVGLLSSVYLALRIVKLLRDWRKKDHDDGDLL